MTLYSEKICRICKQIKQFAGGLTPKRKREILLDAPVA